MGKGGEEPKEEAFMSTCKEERTELPNEMEKDRIELARLLLKSHPLIPCLSTLLVRVPVIAFVCLASVTTCTVWYADNQPSMCWR